MTTHHYLKEQPLTRQDYCLVASSPSIQDSGQDGGLYHFDDPAHVIPRVPRSQLTPHVFFERYQQPGIPVIISGLLDDMPVWDLDFLEQTLGHLEFPVRYYGRQRYQQDKRQWTSSGSGVEAHTMRFSQYAAMLRSGEAYQHDAYLARCSFTNTPLEDTPALYQAEASLGLHASATSLNLWVGSGGHTSSLHYDPMDGTLMQLYGAKQILLFPPSQLYNLYPIPVLNHLRYGLQLRAVYSQVYPERPDFAVFPKFERALEHYQIDVLNSGEILFLPAGWWHEVTSLGTGTVCSVNRFWHVVPISRGLRSWSKWRAHLGGVLATPHVAVNLFNALRSDQRQGELRKLLQRL